MSDLTPMMKQYEAIKINHKDALLFFRLGDFYEMFLDDAVTASRELEITLTARDGGNGKKIPMCGVPYHAVDGYLAKLISRGYKVAICEQMEDPRSAKGIVKREVIRIVTPGTVLESNMLQESSQNYLLAISHHDSHFGIAYTDISTGEFMTTEISGDTTEQKLFDEIARINPAECILPMSLYHDELFRAKLLKTVSLTITKVADDNFLFQDALKQVLSHFQVASADALGLKDLPSAICATGAILSFLKETQKKDLSYLNHLRTYSISSFMMIDQSTRRNLELISTIREGQRKGSLLWVCDKTSTALGARLVKQWMEKPLLVKEHIVKRLNAVEELTNNVFAREDIRLLLKKIYDLERLMSRIAYGSANPRDLIALKNSVTALPEMGQLINTLQSDLFQDLAKSFDPLEDISILVEKSINDDPPLSTREGGIIKEGYDGEVDELRGITSHGKQWIAELEAKEKNRTGIKSLKVGFNKVFGYFIEVTHANLSSVPDHYVRKQTLANAERYITQELKEWENKILGAGEKLASREYELFHAVRETIALSAGRIQQTARVIAQIDVLLSFAIVALENNYVKPEINENDIIHIMDGRHPVVEKIAGTNYVPNDTYLDNQEHQVCLLTGPNMAGKSTYMRQVALCVLMAQIGCFVPAAQAKIGLVDRIFTRVGAADDLAGGQSTFMVEMCETSNILRHATKSSLIILDEIGRGTSTYDGLSIAWAVVEYILKPQVGAKTLFATHYHELTELAEKYPQVKNYSVAVKEKEGGIIFLRKIVPGGTDKSYGIQVAKLAGLPEELLNRAKEILLELEQTDMTGDLKGKMTPDKHKPLQMSFFVPDPPKHPLVAELESLDLNNLTPLDALLKLNQWQRKLKNYSG
ncbi:DNA mismatch repair protein MutS [Candidatus Formimonas warabiya]|nr:DNA mismatch repair protein MutS [Candidatus Formimonas warabiya]